MDVGDRLGRYQLDLALGGVWAARDLDLDRSVALEMISPTQVRAARALARLRHPNVVAVYDVAAIDGRDVLVMELVPGETLPAWIARAKPPRRELVEVVVAIGRAVEAAHAVNVSHGGIAARRVMRESSGRVVVLGFRLPRGAPISSGEPDTVRIQPPTLATRAESPRPDEVEDGFDDDDEAYCALVRELVPDAPAQPRTIAEMVTALDRPEVIRLAGVSRTSALALAMTVGAATGIAALALHDDPVPPPVAAPKQAAAPTPPSTPEALGPEEHAVLRAMIDKDLESEPWARELVDAVKRDPNPTKELQVQILSHRSRAVATQLLEAAPHFTESSTGAEVFTALTGRLVPRAVLDDNAAGVLFEYWGLWGTLTPDDLCTWNVEPRVHALHALAWLAHGWKDPEIASVAKTIGSTAGCDRAAEELLDIAMDDLEARGGAESVLVAMRQQGNAAKLDEIMNHPHATDVTRLAALRVIARASEPFPFEALARIRKITDHATTVHAMRMLDERFALACRDAWERAGAARDLCLELLPGVRTATSIQVLAEHLEAVARTKAVPAWRDALALVYRGRRDGVPANLATMDAAGLQALTTQVLQDIHNAPPGKLGTAGDDDK